MGIIERYSYNTSYVFPWVLGRDMTELEVKERMGGYMSNLRRRYLSISKECGFSGYFTFYTARISAATYLVNNGANLKAVLTALDKVYSSIVLLDD